MMRTIPLLGVIALVASGRLPAQARDSATGRHDAQVHQVAGQRPDSGRSPSWRRSAVHYGKWLPLAAAVTLTALSAHEHDNSNREWSQLLSVCRANNADCQLGPDGRYLNPTAEQVYQSALNFDRRARSRLLAGQATLLVAAGLFIADLRRHSSGPGNIPFAPLEAGVAPGAGGSALVGVRVKF